jgi:hypothetical protein
MADIYLEKVLTVGELIEFLKHFKDETKIYIEHPSYPRFSNSEAHHVSAIYDYTDSSNPRISLEFDDHKRPIEDD